MINFQRMITSGKKKTQLILNEGETGTTSDCDRRNAACDTENP